MGESVRLESTIDRVVVYRRGARVTRNAPLAAMTQKLPASASIGGLPLGIDDASIRVRVTGVDPSVALPIALEMRVLLEVASVDPSLPPPESPEVRKARRRVDSLGGELARLSEEQSRVCAVDQSPRPEGRRGEPPPPSPFESRMALSSFIAARDAKLRAAIALVGDALMIAEEELATLVSREREASSERQRRREELTKTVVVTLDDGDAGAAVLQVSYVVPGARWCPTYTMQLSPGFGTTRLAVRGTVFQATGEDWRNVQMLLSTAEPERWHELPVLSSLRIGKRQHRPSVRGWRPPPTGADELFLAYDRGRPAPLEPDSDSTSARTTRWLGRGAAVGARGSLQRFAPIRDDDEDTMVNRPETRAPSDSFRGRAEQQVAPRQAGMVEKAKSAMELSATITDSATRMPDVAAFQAQALISPARHAMAPASARAEGGGGFLSAIGDLLGSSGGGSASLDEDYPAGMPMAAGPAGLAQQANVGRRLAKPRPALAEDEPLLAFDALRMAGADEPERGTLVLVETRERYVEEIVRARGIAVRETVLVALDHALDAASERASEITDRALPPRCASPDSTLGFDYAYPTSSRVDVPSDGSFHSVPLADQECPAHLRHVVVPRESTDVYRIVELDNPIDAPLLDGPVDVYVAGRYLLTSDIHTVPAGGRLSIGIGVEQRVKVARNCRYSEETEGLMRGTIALKHEIAVELSSHLDEPCDLEVRERLPTTVEKDDEVRVDPGKVEPAWEPYEPSAIRGDPRTDVGPPLRGGYRWRLTLPKGEKRTLSASYTIRTSSKNELAGGNRRER